MIINWKSNSNETGSFDVSLVGEGIVWVGKDPTGKRISFKTKGEKHSASKEKVIVSVGPEHVASVQAFVEKTVTDNRFNQAIGVVFGSAKQADVKKMGDLLKWMSLDVQKEESDTLEASGLTWKDVQGAVITETKKRFMALPM